MSKSRGLQGLLDQAKEKEKEYDWLKAAELYGQALGEVGKEGFLRRGELQEQIGYCLYRGAFQAETQEEFKTCMQKAVEAYEKAAEVYEKVDHAKGLYCKAMALYARSSILIDGSQRKAVLDDCANLMKKAMKAFSDAGDRLGCGKVCNDLFPALQEQYAREWDWPERKKYLEAGIELGKNAISALSEVGDKTELARAYSFVGMACWAATLTLGEEVRGEFRQETLDYAEKALALSQETDDDYLIALSRLLAGIVKYGLTDNLKGSLTHFEEALDHAKKTGDNFLIGEALGWIAAVAEGILFAEEEDPERKRPRFESIIHQAKDSIRHLLIVHSYSSLPDSYYRYSESYMFLALEVETDAKERRALLDKAIKIGLEGLELSERASVPQVATVHHVLSKVFYTLAKAETQTAEKRRLLEAALKHREKNLAIIERFVSPFDYWDIGVGQNYLALIEAETAAIETDDESKRRLLESAVSRMERCVDLCAKWVTLHPRSALLTFLGFYYDWFGGILNQLYSLTGKKETLEKAAEIYQSTVGIYRRMELPSRLAEAYWNAARLYDQLGECAKSEHNFQSASEHYGLAAEKIPQLKRFYRDHAFYMKAWSEIEKAKRHHRKRQYGQAREHYEKAATLHKSTEQWAYLASNYLAWARLEEAEDLSRREQAEHARDLFEQVAKMFLEAEVAIQTQLDRVKVKAEKEILAKMIRASKIRREYCLGRIALEEAKILDRQGDHDASSRRYGSAAEGFQKAMTAMHLESDRQELRPILCLSKAWQMMTRAEAEASPELYLEASKLFEEAKKHSSDEKAKLLALGHKHFCKALEAGARFEEVNDTKTYSLAIRQMETATKHYLKAGFKNASEYAKATQRLFDAYIYTDKAKQEADPRKKAQFFHMAERTLQASAGSYMQAKHPEKSEQVQRLLENIKEERQLAMSLTEVLHAPAITSTTASFSTPIQTQEQALGIRRFEHADIQANLILRVKEANVGEDLDLMVELVNAGKAPALLIKVDGIVPQGFDVKEVPETCTVENSFLNLKGRKLNPLKTADIKIVVKPRSKGTFSINPRVLYIDETGKSKSHEPEPVTITVKELGIGGWIKGER